MASTRFFGDVWVDPFELTGIRVLVVFMVQSHSALLQFVEVWE